MSIKKYPFIPLVDIIPLLSIDTITGSTYLPGGNSSSLEDIDDEDEVW